MRPENTADLTVKGKLLSLAIKRHPVKTQLICGFLGAGKTTFILEQLKTAGSDTVVLVNEFGELGIDGETIRAASGLDIVELPGGCICCSQKLDLIESVKNIAESICPELLLIEPSGVAETSELLIALSDKSLQEIIRLDAVLALVDATTFLEFSEPETFGLFFLDQLENADVIVVNKIDLVDNGDLGAVIEKARQINPSAIVAKTEFGRLSGALPGIERKAKVIGHDLDFKVSSIGIRPDRVLPHDFVERLLTELSRGAFGNVLRAKGFLKVEDYGTVNIQVSPGSISVELLNRETAPRLTFIGSDLNEEHILSYFSDLSV